MTLDEINAKILKWIFIMCNTRRHHTHKPISIAPSDERANSDVTYFHFPSGDYSKGCCISRLICTRYYCVTGLDFRLIALGTIETCMHYVWIHTACSNQYASNYLMMNSKGSPFSTNTWSLPLSLSLSFSVCFVSLMRKSQRRLSRHTHTHKQSNKHLNVSVQ